LRKAALGSRDAPFLSLRLLTTTEVCLGTETRRSSHARLECDLTQVGKTTVRHGVHIVGATDLTSRMAFQFSEMYAQNIVNLMAHQGMGEHAATFKLDVDDAVLRPMLVTHNGAELPPPPPPPPPTPTPTPPQPPSSSSVSPRTPKSSIVEVDLPVSGKKKERRATPFVPRGDSGGGGGVKTKSSASSSKEPLYFWKVSVSVRSTRVI